MSKEVKKDLRLRIFLLLTLTVIVLHPLPTFANEEVTNNGWYEENGKQYYYKDNLVVKGWVALGDNWYYFSHSDGTLHKGWLYDNGKWYFMNNNGVMQRGC